MAIRDRLRKFSWCALALTLSACSGDAAGAAATLRARGARVLPRAAGHGWDMLTGSTGSFTPLARQFMRFLERHG